MRRSYWLLFLLLLPVALAKSGHITLLTVVQHGDQSLGGGTADLYLDVKPGSGRIFIDSFPLTKIDTQISTRLANQVACSYIETDCLVYDFFYKIEANSPLVGGPSAGGALAVLTIAVLKDLSLDNETVMTGTIDTGGLIGPVSGIYEKAKAAEQAGYKKILIPKWASSVLVITLPSNATLNLTNSSHSTRINKTLSLLNYTNQTNLLSNLSIQIIKIGNIDEALYEFTKQNFTQNEHIETSSEYTQVMQKIADELCNRTRSLQNLVDKRKLNYTDESNFSKRATSTYTSARYYATASYCFSQNIRLLARVLQTQTNSQRYERMLNLTVSVTELDQKIDAKDLQTLSDLETYMIVKERVLEALESLRAINTSNVSSNLLSYASERYHSANVWSGFFGLPGQPLSLDQDHLKEGCQKKISEAEERLSYVDIYAPGYLRRSREELGFAYLQRAEKRYVLCLSTASRVKAEADVFITASAVDSNQLVALAQEQLSAAKRVIAKEQAKGLFPILGYSYVEYAETLIQDDPLSAITFSQYALELSNLDMYFPQPKAYNLPFDYFFFIFMGMILGVLGTKLYDLKRR
ncbi:MAG: S16 family serine protease [Nanoarchaeota archaeon]